MRLAVNKKKPKTACIPFLRPDTYHMKPSGNETFNGPDHEMVCDRSFFGFFTRGRSLQSSTGDVTI